MTVDAALVVWIVFCACALVTSVLSLRLIHLVLRAVIKAAEPVDVIDGTRHIRRDQSLLVLVWAVFLCVGLLALFDTPVGPAPPRQSTIGLWAVWLLIGAVGVLSYKTIVDYLYSRAVWRRRGPD